MNPRQSGRRIRIEVRDSGHVDEWFEMAISDAELEALRQRAQVQRKLKDGPKYDPASATWRWGDVEITDEYLLREHDRAMRGYERPSFRDPFDTFARNTQAAANAAREAAEKLKREQEERYQRARKAAEEERLREKARQEERARQERARRDEEYIRNLFGDGTFRFRFQGPPGSSGTNTGGTGSRPKPPPTNTSTDALKNLARLAGVEWSEAQKLTAAQLYRRAQRKCHPDTGGSHEKWIEMQRYARALGLD